jgi:hypothetical protein
VAVSGRTDENSPSKRRGWAVRAKKQVRADRAVPLGLSAGLAIVVMTGIAGCNTNPHSPDLSAPPQVVEPAATGSDHGATGSHPKKSGIQLPNTITLAYDRTPTFQDVPHHVVLWNTNQAVKAELNAAYEKTSAATPDLKRYWTGAGYTTAHSWAQSWIDAKQRPVGLVVISNVSVDSLTNVQSSVTYCQDLSGVIRGDVLTHTGGKPIQEPHTNGQKVRLTMVPSGTKGQWQVSAETVVSTSPDCPPPTGHRKPKH